MRADLNAKLNTNFCGTLCWQERGGTSLHVPHTLGKAFGKAAVSSFLKTELKPNQLATFSHTHMSQGNPELVGTDRLDLKGTSEWRRQEGCLILVLFFLKICPLEGQ